MYDEKGNLLAADTEQYSHHINSGPALIGVHSDQATDTPDASSFQEGKQQPTLIFEGACVTVDRHCASLKSLRGYIQVTARQTLPDPECQLPPDQTVPTTSTVKAAQNPSQECICVLLGASPIWSPRIYLRPAFSFRSVEVPPKTLAPNLAEQSALSRYRSFFDEDERYERENPRRISTLGGMGRRLYSFKTRMLLTPPYLLTVFVGFMVFPVLAFTWTCWAIVSYFIRHVLASIFPDFFSIAHLLRLEDVGNGYYERRGVQEMHYTKFKRLKPETRTIKLI